MHSLCITETYFLQIIKICWNWLELLQIKIIRQRLIKNGINKVKLL